MPDDPLKQLQDHMQRELSKLPASVLPAAPYYESNIRPLDDDLLDSIRSMPQANAEDIQEAIHRHISSLQAKLSPEEQLLVYCTSGLETIYVHQIGYPNWHTIILIGKDGNGCETSMVAAVNTVQLTCKVVEVQAPQKPYRIGFVRPGDAAR